jgi:hypothetical protein
LLGPKCRKCSKVTIKEAASHAALVSSARARQSKFNALVASGTVTAWDSKGRPTRLRVNDSFDAPIRFVPQRCGCDDCLDAYSRRA